MSKKPVFPPEIVPEPTKPIPPKLPEISPETEPGVLPPEPSTIPQVEPDVWPVPESQPEEENE